MPAAPSASVKRASSFSPGKHVVQALGLAGEVLLVVGIVDELFLRSCRADWMPKERAGLFELVGELQQEWRRGPAAALNIMPIGSPLADCASGSRDRRSPVTFCSGVNATQSTSRSMIWS